MSLINTIKSVFLVLADELSLPHLALNQDNRCSFQFEGEMNIEILVNETGGLNLVAYIDTFLEPVALLQTLKNLLLWNNSQHLPFGSFFALCDQTSAITYNAHLYLQEIDSVTLENILNNFLLTAKRLNQNVRSFQAYKSDLARGPSLPAELSSHILYG